MPLEGTYASPATQRESRARRTRLEGHPNDNWRDDPSDATKPSSHAKNNAESHSECPAGSGGDSCAVDTKRKHSRDRDPKTEAESIGWEQG